MKTIGILGGMGPLAAARLYERVVVLTKAGSDNEHIPMIIDNNTNIPDRTEHILNNGKNPVYELVRSALRLEFAGADAIAIACNTAHFYYDEVIKFVKIPVINMIEETATYVGLHFPEADKVGLLATEGTCISGIYERVFRKKGIEVLIPDALEQKYVTDVIYSVKSGGKINTEAVKAVAAALKQCGAKTLILGCTELPIVFDRFDICKDYVDSTEVLAISIIAYAGKSITPM